MMMSDDNSSSLIDYNYHHQHPDYQPQQQQQQQQPAADGANDEPFYELLKQPLHMVVVYTLLNHTRSSLIEIRGYGCRFDGSNKL